MVLENFELGSVGFLVVSRSHPFLESLTFLNVSLGNLVEALPKDLMRPLAHSIIQTAKTFSGHVLWYICLPPGSIIRFIIGLIPLFSPTFHNGGGCQEMPM